MSCVIAVRMVHDLCNGIYSFIEVTLECISIHAHPQILGGGEAREFPRGAIAS